MENPEIVSVLQGLSRVNLAMAQLTDRLTILDSTLDRIEGRLEHVKTLSDKVKCKEEENYLIASGEISKISSVTPPC